MLPTPVINANEPLMVDIEKGSINEIKNIFISALTPLITAVKTLKNEVVEAFAPDPEERTDRGKDLQNIEGLSEGKDKPEFDTKGGGFGLGAFKAVIVGALGLLALKFKEELQTLINTIKFPQILAGLAAVAKVFTLGFVDIMGKIKKLKLIAGLGGAGPVSRFLTTFGKFTTQVAKLGNTLMSTFSFLKPVLGIFSKLALPLTVIFSLIDAVKGFIEGYKDGGIIDGVLTAIGSVLGGLVGLPLDFIKNIFAFLLEKLGFDQVAEAMKDFSFKDMIKNVFGGIVDFFAAIPRFVEKGLRALGKAGNFIADKIFGKDKDNEIAKREEIQKDAQEVIDKEKGRQQTLDTIEEGVDKSERAGTGRQNRKKRQIQQKRAASQRRQIAAEDEQSKAAQENLALKTGGPKGEENLTKREFYAKLGAGEIKSVEDAEFALGRPLTEKEGDFLKSKIDSERNVKEDLANLEFAEDLEAEVLEKPRRRRRRRGREDEFATDVARAKMGVDLDAPGTTQVKMVEGKVVEGKTLDEVGDPKAQFGVNAPQDNSQTDNSQTTTNNNVTHNNYGGGDGPMNTSNPDGTLFGATKYATADL